VGTVPVALDPAGVGLVAVLSGGVAFVAAPPSSPFSFAPRGSFGPFLVPASPATVVTAGLVEVVDASIVASPPVVAVPSGTAVSVPLPVAVDAGVPLLLPVAADVLVIGSSPPFSGCMFSMLEPHVHAGNVTAAKKRATSPIERVWRMVVLISYSPG
jgi:hypothetical protein